MLIEMLSRARFDTPDGGSVVYKANKRYTVEDWKARHLINGGKAIEVDASPHATASLDAALVHEAPVDLAPGLADGTVQGTHEPPVVPDSDPVVADSDGPVREAG